MVATQAVPVLHQWCSAAQVRIPVCDNKIPLLTHKEILCLGQVLEELWAGPGHTTNHTLLCKCFTSGQAELLLPLPCFPDYLASCFWCSLWLGKRLLNPSSTNCILTKQKLRAYNQQRWCVLLSQAFNYAKLMAALHPERKMPLWSIRPSAHHQGRCSLQLKGTSAIVVWANPQIEFEVIKWKRKFLWQVISLSRWQTIMKWGGLAGKVYDSSCVPCLSCEQPGQERIRGKLSM